MVPEAIPSIQLVYVALSVVGLRSFVGHRCCCCCCFDWMINERSKMVRSGRWNVMKTSFLLLSPPKVIRRRWRRPLMGPGQKCSGRTARFGGVDGSSYYEVFGSAIMGLPSPTLPPPSRLHTLAANWKDDVVSHEIGVKWFRLKH